MKDGFLKVAVATPECKVADCVFNREQILNKAIELDKRGVKFLVFPEFSLTGYTCHDLFLQDSLEQGALRELLVLAEETKSLSMVMIVGLPLERQGRLYNVAAVVCGGKILGFVPKSHIPNYSEFYEKRWFASGDQFDSCQPISIAGFDTTIGSQIFDLGSGATLGIEICEDLWVSNPPSSELCRHGANIIVNPSASDEYVSKAKYRYDLISNQSARCMCSYIYSSASVFESTTDLVFSGATHIAENGIMLASGERFKRDSQIIIADIDIEKLNTIRNKDTSFTNLSSEIGFSKINVINDENDLKFRYVDAYPFVPSNDDEMKERCEEIFAIQASGLAKRLEHVGSNGCVIGISGGLDSTLALLVSVEAMKLLNKPVENILGITMPGFGTTDRTYNNAIMLMKSLGVSIKEISIKDACLQHFSDIGHSESIKDITYENTQARERTQILFDISNKHNCLLVGTGDLSELAMGWCTYNGDHMSMYAVNCSVPKTLVRYLVDYVADNSDDETKAILKDILDTPVSPELLPPDSNGEIAQKTEDNIGPYELHDFFLYNFVRFGFSKEKLLVLAEKAFKNTYDKKTIDKWLKVFIKRFFISQFKRSCVPDGPKVGSVSLSPRGDWRMPSDADFTSFI